MIFVCLWIQFITVILCSRAANEPPALSPWRAVGLRFPPSFFRGRPWTPFGECKTVPCQGSRKRPRKRLGLDWGLFCTILAKSKVCCFAKNDGASLFERREERRVVGRERPRRRAGAKPRNGGGVIFAAVRQSGATGQRGEGNCLPSQLLRAERRGQRPRPKATACLRNYGYPPSAVLLNG